VADGLGQVGQNGMGCDGEQQGDGWKLQVKVRLAVYPVTQGYTHHIYILYIVYTHTRLYAVPSKLHQFLNNFVPPSEAEKARCNARQGEPSNFVWHYVRVSFAINLLCWPRQLDATEIN